MAQQIFKKSLLGLIVCIGLAGCSTTDAPTQEIVGTGEVLTTQGMEPIYLTEHYVETYEVKPGGVRVPKVRPEKPIYINAKEGNDLSVSKPASIKATSVKDKAKPAVSTQKVEVKSKENVAVSKPAAPVAVKAVETKKSTTTVKKVVKQETKQQEKQLSDLEKKVLYGEESHDWPATQGDTLRSLLMAWGEKSGWTVAWKLDRDYHLEAGVIFQGDFVHVASA
ncbi:MAG: TcpQ domain-containing protein, partial [Lactobacillales bacterium]|nr:TcpQ domain-containing protein [Lactobacillales bacterium]